MSRALRRRGFVVAALQWRLFGNGRGPQTPLTAVLLRRGASELRGVGATRRRSYTTSGIASGAQRYSQALPRFPTGWVVPLSRKQ